MTAHEVMYDMRYPRQEEALWLAQNPGDFPPVELVSWAGDLVVRGVGPWMS